MTLMKSKKYIILIVVVLLPGLVYADAITLTGLAEDESSGSDGLRTFMGVLCGIACGYYLVRTAISMFFGAGLDIASDLYFKLLAGLVAGALAGLLLYG